MRILRDFVVFAGTSRIFVSWPSSSSLILKSIRQRLIEGTINTVNRSLCNYTRNQPNTFTAWLKICDRFNGLCWYASECNEQHFCARNQTNILNKNCPKMIKYSLFKVSTMFSHRNGTMERDFLPRAKTWKTVRRTRNQDAAQACYSPFRDNQLPEFCK